MRTIFGWDRGGGQRLRCSRWWPACRCFVAACGSDDKSSTSTAGGGGSSTTAKAAADVTKCGKKPGTKATGTPIKVGAIVTKQPGTDFTDGANMAAGVLQLRQRQRRHQRPPDLVQVLHRADQPGPDRGLRPQADPDRQGGRDRRRLLHHRVRRGPQVLGVARHHGDRCRHRSGVLRHARTAPPRTWARATAPTAPCRPSCGRGRRRSPSTSPTCRAPGTSPPAPRPWPRASTCPSRSSRTTCRSRTRTRSR